MCLTGLFKMGKFVAWIYLSFTILNACSCKFSLILLNTYTEINDNTCEPGSQLKFKELISNL